MRIVSWNCAGGFSSRSNVAGYPKYEKLIDALKPDILLVQECEHKDKLVQTLKDTCTGWFGYTREDRSVPKARIVGVSAFSFNKDIKIDVADESILPAAKFIQPMRISHNGKVFNLINTWVNTAHSKEWKWDLFKKFIKERDTIIMGDFNWPSSDPKAVQLLDEMKTLSLISAYHAKKNEKFGQESKMTNRTRKKTGKEYFIDYCFVPNAWLDKISFDVGSKAEWIDSKFSDHCPLVLDLKQQI